MSIPGYADIQINGYRNVDFSDPALTETDFLRTADGQSPVQLQPFARREREEPSR